MKRFLMERVAGLLDGILWGALVLILTKRKRILLCLQSLCRWNEETRFSIAYLYQIKIEDKYLLIKGNRIDQYQPIGGVYKYYDSFNDLANKINIEFENEEGFFEEKDLRFYAKGRHTTAILDWFDTGSNREISVYREFIEEIIEPGILPIDVLKNIKIEFIKQVKPKMAYSTHFEKNEILVFNIFRIEMENLHIETIKKYTENKNSILKLINSKDIRKECTDHNGKSTKIGAHTKYIL